jgi:Tol biopolymer transport system component
MQSADAFARLRAARADRYSCGATGALTPWFETSAVEDQPRVSPDGNWVVYVSDVSGAPEVYVRRYGGGPPDILVSNGRG